jgi:hypothetical protein
MTSRALGRSTLKAEVTSIGKNGFWVLQDDREYFIPFDDYPVFRTATVRDICAVESKVPGQLRWKALDCDIELAALDTPDRFPLVFQ